jgi:hypothetical protein
MPCTNYEVVTDSVTVLAAGDPVQEFRLTAPSGKQPICGSHYDPRNAVLGGYPDGDDWVFKFYPVSPDRTVDLYLVCGWV